MLHTVGEDIFSNFVERVLAIFLKWSHRKKISATFFWDLKKNKYNKITVIKSVQIIYLKSFAAFFNFS